MLIKSSRRFAKRKLKNPNKKIRIDKETHLIEIDKFVTKIIKEQNRIPHQVEIAKAVGLSRETISKLLGEISLVEMAESHVSRLKTSDFITSLLLQGQKGNIPAGKLWLQIVHNWAERMDFNFSGKVKVNGTLDLSKITDEQLRALTEIKKKISAGS